MSALAVLQQDFLHALTGDSTRASAALDGGRGIAPDLGLQIYVNAYSARLREALENDHAQLAKYLGDELWQPLVAGYIAAHPSQQTSLRNFAQALPEFLRRQAPFNAHPVLAELAAFERSLLDSFDAAEAPLATWEALLDTPPSRWPQLRPSFVPSLGRLGTRMNTVEIWLALKEDRSPPAAAAVTGDWAIWRDSEQVTRFRSLGTEDAALLDHFLAGGDFSSGCEALQRWHPAEAVPALAVQTLGRWCADGWIRAWEAQAR